MSSLLGDFPEPPSSKDFRFLGYFVVGLFFSVYPAYVLYVFLLTTRRAAPDAAWQLPALVWFACATWTGHMGATERLQIPNRLFSALICLIQIAVACSYGAKVAFLLALHLFLPLLCIWFGDLMGGYIGRSLSHRIDEKSPGINVAFGGWFYVAGVPIVTLLLSRQLR